MQLKDLNFEEEKEIYFLMMYTTWSTISALVFIANSPSSYYLGIFSPVIYKSNFQELQLT